MRVRSHSRSAVSVWKCENISHSALDSFDQPKFPPTTTLTGYRPHLNSDLITDQGLRAAAEDTYQDSITTNARRHSAAALIKYFDNGSVFNQVFLAFDGLGGDRRVLSGDISIVRSKTQALWTRRRISSVSTSALVPIRSSRRCNRPPSCSSASWRSTEGYSANTWGCHWLKRAPASPVARRQPAAAASA
jgi:hypothetical protein